MPSIFIINLENIDNLQELPQLQSFSIEKDIQLLCCITRF